MLYTKPKMDILKLETEDVIRTSLNGGDNDDYNGQGQMGGDSTSTKDKW